MHMHRSFSRRSKAESEKLSEKTHESFREDIASYVFTSAPYIEHEVRRKMDGNPSVGKKSQRDE